MGPSFRPTNAPELRPVRAASARTWSVSRLGTYYRLAAAILGDTVAAEDVTFGAFEVVWRRRRKIATVEVFESELMRQVVAGCKSRGPRSGDATFRRAALRLSAPGESQKRWYDPHDTLDWSHEPRPAETSSGFASEAEPYPPETGAGSFDTALRSLGVEDRIVLVLHHATDMAPDAIASALGTTPQAVEARLGHVDATLTAALEHDEMADPGRRPRRHPAAEEIRRRLPLPAAAPQSLLDRAEMRMTLVSLGGQPRLGVRLRFAIPIAFLLLTVAFVGSGAWRAVANVPLSTLAPGHLPATVDAFGRVDTAVSWAIRGTDLYITRDGGASWSESTVPVGSVSDRDSQLLWPDVYYPFFLDSSHGWMLTWEPAGSDRYTLTVHRTADGGRTWRSATLRGVYPGFGDVQFTDQKHGWLTIVRPDTLDALSQSWTGILRWSPDPTQAIPRYVIPDDATTILATSDGGQTWSLRSTFPGIAAVRFVGEKEGWGELTTTQAGSVDAIVHTTDGGRTWTKSSLPEAVTVQCQSVPAPRLPVRDGGRLRLALPCLQTIPFVVPAEPGASETLWSIPPALVGLVSADGGRTWAMEGTTTESGRILQTSLALNLARIGREQPLLSLPPDGSVELATFDGPPAVAAAASVSFDAGATWKPLSLPALVPLQSIEFAGPRDVWIAAGDAVTGGAWGRPGPTYKTTEGGESWAPVLGALPLPSRPQIVETPAVETQAPAPETPYPTEPVLAEQVLDVGFSGGLGWVQTESSVWMTGANVRAQVGLPAVGTIQVIGPDNLVLVSGPVPRPDSTTDSELRVYRWSGGDWHMSAFAVGQDNAGMPWAHFADAGHGVVYIPAFDENGPVPSACRRYVTADGGATWKEETAACVSGAVFVDDSTGFAFSPPDSILALQITTDGGATWRATRLPELAGYTPVALVAFAREPSGILDAAYLWKGSSDEMIELIHSADGGRSWSLDGHLSGRFGAIAYRGGAGEFVAFAPQEGAAGQTTQVTVDRGKHWTETAAEGLVGDVAWVEFETAAHGWAVVNAPCSQSSTSCGGNSIYETTDGGASWHEVWPPYGMR